MSINEISILSIEDFEDSYFETCQITEVLPFFIYIIEIASIKWTLDYSCSGMLCPHLCAGSLLYWLLGLTTDWSKYVGVLHFCRRDPARRRTTATLPATAAAAELASTDSELFNDNDDNDKHLAATRELGENSRGHTNSAGEATLHCIATSSQLIFENIQRITFVFFDVYVNSSKHFKWTQLLKTLLTNWFSNDPSKL